jgi:TP901 family phage tail tape measure protein
MNLGGGIGDASGEVVIDVSRALQQLTLLESRLNGMGSVGSGALKGLDQAGQRVDTLTNKADRFEKAYGVAGKASLGFGLIVAGGFGLGLRAAANFEQGMTNVGASLGGVGENGKITEQVFKDLNDEALRIGKETAFSASEAAAAMDELAKAGQSAEQILQGSAEASVDLAAAIGVNIPDAATAVASAMATFRSQNLSAADAADILTAAVNGAATDLPDLQAGLRNLGPQAANLGLTFEEAAAGVAFFTNFGLRGADAGVSLARALDNIASPTSEASALMTQLGIDAFDAQGAFIGFPDLMDQMNVALQGSSDELKVQALQMIFGAEAADVMGIAVLEGGDALRQLTGEVTANGQANEQAAQRMNTLSGDVETLKGSLETMGIVIGRTVIPATRGLVQFATQLINRFLELGEGTQKVIAAILGVVGGFALLAGGIAVALPSVLRFADSFGKVLQVFPRMVKGIQAVSLAFRALLLANPWILALVAAIALLYAAYQTNFLGFGDGVRKVASLIGDAFGAIARRVEDVIDMFSMLRSAGLDPVSAAFKAVGIILQDLGLEGVGKAFYDIGASIQKVVDHFKNFLDTGSIASGTLKGLPDPIRGVVRAFTAFANVFQDLQAAWRKGTLFRDLPRILRVFGRELGKALTNITGIEGLGKIFAQAGEMVGRAIQGIIRFVEDLVRNFQIFRNAGLDPIEAAFASLSVAFPVLEGLFMSMSGVIHAIIGVFKELVDTVQAVVKGFQEGGLGGAVDALLGQIPELGKAFLNLLSSILSYWGEIGKLLIQAVRAVDWGAVVAKLGDAAGAIVTWIAGIAADIDWLGLLANLGDITADIVGKLGDLLAALEGWIEEKAGDVDWLKLLINLAEITADVVGKLGDLGEAVIGWIGDHVPALGDWVELASEVGDITGDIVDKLGDLGEAVQEWVGGVADAVNWDTIFDTVISAFDSVGEAITGIENAATTVKNNIGAIITGITDAIGKIDDVIDTALTPVREAIEAVESAAGFLQDAVGWIPGFGSDGGDEEEEGPSAGDALAAAASMEEAASRIEEARSKIVTAMQGVQTDIQTQFDGIKSLFSNFETDAGTAGEDAGDAFQTEFNSQLGDAVEDFRVHKESINILMGRFVTESRVFGRTAGNEFQTEWNDQIGDAVDDFSVHKESINILMGRLVTESRVFGDVAGNQFQERIGAGFDRAVDRVRNAVAAIGRALQSLGSQYGYGFSIGSSLGEGIYAGIGSWVWRIAAEAARAVREGIFAARREAESASPSKKTEDLGQDLGMGLVLGLQRSALDVQRAFAGLIPSADLRSMGLAGATASRGAGPVTLIQVNALRSEELVRILEDSATGAAFAETYPAELGLT